MRGKDLQDELNEFNEFFEGQALTKEEEELIRELKQRETNIEKQFKQHFK